MTYQEALSKSKGRAGKAEGQSLLAIAVASLARIHAINPEMVYDGAVQRGLTHGEVLKMSPMELADLMFA